MPLISLVLPTWLMPYTRRVHGYRQDPIQANPNDWASNLRYNRESVGAWEPGCADLREVCMAKKQRIFSSFKSMHAGQSDSLIALQNDLLKEN